MWETNPVRQGGAESGKSAKSARSLSADYLGEVARGYADFFFQYTESPLLIVNTSEIDFAGSLETQDDLVAVIRRTRAGISHYNPLGSR